jgi:hypothetical protein
MGDVQEYELYCISRHAYGGKGKHGKSRCAYNQEEVQYTRKHKEKWQEVASYRLPPNQHKPMRATQCAVQYLLTSFVVLHYL